MKQSLNFEWSFIKGFDESFLEEFNKKRSEIVNIPHNPVEIPYNYFSEKIYQGLFSYEKLFNVDDFNENKVYILKFEGFMLKADIYLNGHKLGNFYSGYLPVSIDVTSFIRKNNNRLVVILDSNENKDYPPFGFAVDYLTFAGIYREVYLESHLKTYLSNFYIHGDSKGNIDLLYDVNGNDEIKVENIIFDKNHREKGRFFGNSFKLENFELWDLDNPILYELHTFVSHNGETEEYVNKFAFRDVKFTNTGFYLNDKKIKLFGLKMLH